MNDASCFVIVFSISALDKAFKAQTSIFECVKYVNSMTTIVLVVTMELYLLINYQDNAKQGVIKKIY